MKVDDAKEAERSASRCESASLLHAEWGQRWLSELYAEAAVWWRKRAKELGDESK